MLPTLIRGQSICVKFKAEDWKEVVDKAGQLLLDTQKIEPRYIDAMKVIIEDNGAYMVLIPGFVLLHARPEDGAKEECIAIVTLAPPVYFGHPKNDPVDLVFAFAASESKSHIQMIKEIAALLQDEPRLDLIREAMTIEAVMDALNP